MRKIDKSSPKAMVIYSAFLLAILFVILSWKPFNQKISSNETNDEIKIGNQVWMAKNLDVSMFRNGDTIPQVKTKKEWQRCYVKKQPAWCYYDNDSLNGTAYGKLYNWFAVSDKRGLAPAGWHIPTGKEWRILVAFLGGRKNKVGKQLKSTTGWNNNGNGDNSFGFNALPSGIRDVTTMIVKSDFRWKGSVAYWWSTDKHKNFIDLEYLVIRKDDNAAVEWHDDISNGYSVRCLKD